MHTKHMFFKNIFLGGYTNHMFVGIVIQDNISHNFARQ